MPSVREHIKALEKIVESMTSAFLLTVLLNNVVTPDKSPYKSACNAKLARYRKSSLLFYQHIANGSLPRTALSISFALTKKFSNDIKFGESESISDRPSAGDNLPLSVTGALQALSLYTKLPVIVS